MKMKILIDADGCPVVNHTIRIGNAYGLDVLILCDTSHVFEREGATTLTVSKGADSVDYALVNRVSPGDIVVTQDYGLAAMCLARQALPIRQDGMIYNQDNIDALLFSRHTAHKIRKGGGRLKGPAKRDRKKLDQAFEQSLVALIEHQLQENQL